MWSQIRIPGSRGASRFTLGALLVILLAVAGCGTPGGWQRENAGIEPVRISELLEGAAGERRASLLCIEDGLEADAQGERSRAMSRYERALQVDPGNPYVYLAIARHEVEGADPASALGFLDKSRTLLRAQGEDSPRVGVHLIGLKGGALYGDGRREEAIPYLRQAREIAPSVWGDGVLTATELR